LANWNFDTISTIQTNEHAWEGLFYVSILAIFGTAIAVILFNRIISVTSALFASSVTYFIPIVAVIIGLNFGEHISSGQIAAMGVILIGVLLVNLGPQLMKKFKNKTTKTANSQ
jgi:drug/metabolite transporter (DMT)-like permease